MRELLQPAAPVAGMAPHMCTRAGFPAVQAYYGLRTYSQGGSYKLIQYPSAPAAPVALLPLACMGVLACVGVLAVGLAWLSWLCTGPYITASSLVHDHALGGR